MDGLFLELGPFRLEGDKEDQIKVNPHSWHHAANMLFIDQPVGTGLSYTRSTDGYPTSDDAVNVHFYAFLTAFFKLHDRYTTVVNGRRQTRPFYISGESHAGHYIPCMAAHILKRNAEVGADKNNNGLFIDLKGIALGNPWTDPHNQYDVSDYAHGHGLITSGQRNKLKEKNRECRRHLKEGRYDHPVCFELLDNVVDSTRVSNSHKVPPHPPFARRLLDRPLHKPSLSHTQGAHVRLAAVRPGRERVPAGPRGRGKVPQPCRRARRAARHVHAAGVRRMLGPAHAGAGAPGEASRSLFSPTPLPRPP